jgi:Ser/Thr protein kinase RdoA (MazF antagonist)
MELTGEVTAEAEAADAAGAAVLAAARLALGPDAALAGPPRLLAGGFGRGAWEADLAGDPGAPWDAPVVVRAGVTAAAAEREAAWHAACAGHGVPVPTVLAVVGGEDGTAAVVTTRGPATSLVEVLGENPLMIPDILRSMAAVHAGLRVVPVAAAPEGTPSADVDPPLAALDAALAATGLTAQFGGERAWLDAHAPPPGPAAVCHGDFQPAVVRLDRGDLAGATIVDWSSARLAVPEYDLALTALMFWSVPYLAEGIAQRKMLKTVRDMIADGYRTAYETAAGGSLDDDRLAYWGAFHALAWAVRLAAAEAAGGPADPWDPVGLVRHPAAYRKDLGRRLARLTRG